MTRCIVRGMLIPTLNWEEFSERSGEQDEKDKKVNNFESIKEAREGVLTFFALCDYRNRCLQRLSLPQN